MHLDARGNHALQLHFFWSRPVQEGLAATTKMLHALRDDAVIVSTPQPLVLHSTKDWQGHWFAAKVSFREKMAKYISILQHSLGTQLHENGEGSYEEFVKRHTAIMLPYYHYYQNHPRTCKNMQDDATPSKTIEDHPRPTTHPSHLWTCHVGDTLVRSDQQGEAINSAGGQAFLFFSSSGAMRCRQEFVNESLFWVGDQPNSNACRARCSGCRPQGIDIVNRNKGNQWNLVSPCKFRMFRMFRTFRMCRVPSFESHLGQKIEWTTSRHAGLYHRHGWLGRWCAGEGIDGPTGSNCILLFINLQGILGRLRLDGSTDNVWHVDWCRR